MEYVITSRTFKSDDQLLLKILAFFTCVYVGVTNSFMYFIPKSLRIVLLLGIPTLISVIAISIDIAKNKFKTTTPVICVFLMLIISLIWKNYTIQDSGIIGMYGILFPLFFYLATSRSDSWYNVFLNSLIAFGVFYAIGTYFCFIFQNVYYSSIGPTMASFNPYVEYDLNPKAGFTSHYSTNGMFLTKGVIATIAKMFTMKLTKKQKRQFWLILAFQSIAMLLCGKRGLLLCLIVALYVAYFVYKTRRTPHRILKLIGVSVLGVVGVLFASLFIPSIANAITRWFVMSNRNDISTGRFELWGAALQDFAESPLFGHGWRWFLYEGGFNKDVHNVYIQLLCEVGFIGALPFFIFFAYNLIKTLRICWLWRNLKLDINGTPLLFSLIYQVYFIVLMLEGTSIYNPEAFIIYLASCSMIFYYNNHCVKEGRKKVWNYR